ncbi:tetratricopeptide repeat protein [Flavobacterium sp.]|uniref:tetratricopeptide repeat protein n=1 Tax=Flavobacterium sp. TaxID=239 RepID=UPI002B4B0924|nr:tetratricopeptide repeat protein [Flavobacterium sp.]HLF51490.1 tetratricopeptide repeat protein [Flavobacterium sp.]
MRISCLLLLVFLPFFLYGQAKPQQQHIDSLLLEVRNKHADSTKINLFNDISFAYVYLNPNVGIEYANKALALAERIGFQEGIATSNAMLAINYNAKAEYVKAIALNEKALTLYDKLKEKKSTASVYGNLSLIHLSQGNHPQALKTAFQALKIYEEFKDDNASAIILENIGHIYYEQKKYSKTQQYYSKALSIYNNSGNQRDIARALGNISRVLQDENKYQKALDYLFKALKINRDLGIRNSIQINLANIGNVYVKLKEYPKAIRYHSEALKISKELGFKNSIAINYGNLGATYLEMEQNAPKAKISSSKEASQKLKLAINYLEKAVDICDEIGFSAPQIEFSQGLTDAYRLSGNYKMAFETLKSSTALRDSIFSQQSKIELSNLETKRDIELKNKDIIIKNKEYEINQLGAANDRMLYLSGILLLCTFIFILIRYFIKRIKSRDNAMANMIQIQSHEIRGPIASILGLSQLFNFNKPDDPSNKELIEGINILASNLDEVVIKVIKNTKE